MRRLLLLQLTLTLPLLVLILGATLFGERFHPLPSVLRQSCALPCWGGIRPGEMNIDVANQILFSQGYEPQNDYMNRSYLSYIPQDSRCTVRLEHNRAVVVETRISNCPQLRLGDVLAAWGQPDSILHASMSLSFAGGMAHIQLRFDDCDYELSPYTEVNYMRFARTPGILANEVTWHGFMPAWGYKRLSPNTIALKCQP